jgi:hypothetical protein
MSDSINDFMAAFNGVHDREAIARWAWPIAWSVLADEEHKAACEAYRRQLRAAALAALESDPQAVAVEVVGGEVVRVVIVHDRPAVDQAVHVRVGALVTIKPGYSMDTRDEWAGRVGLVLEVTGSNARLDVDGAEVWIDTGRLAGGEVAR